MDEQSLDFNQQAIFSEWPLVWRNSSLPFSPAEPDSLCSSSGHGTKAICMHKLLHRRGWACFCFLWGYPPVSVDGSLHFYMVLLVCAQGGTEKDLLSSGIKQTNRCGCWHAEIFCYCIIIKSRYVSQLHLKIIFHLNCAHSVLLIF